LRGKKIFNMFFYLILCFLLVKSQEDNVLIGIIQDDNNDSVISLLSIDNDVITRNDLSIINQYGLYLESSYHSKHFYTIIVSDDFTKSSIYNISYNGCKGLGDFEDWDYSFSNIHYHCKRDILIVVSISPKTRNYALYSVNIKNNEITFIYDLNTKNIIFASTLLINKDILYIDIMNEEYSTLLGINIKEGSLSTFYEPLSNDPYYTIKLHNTWNYCIFALIYNRKIGVIQLIFINTQREEVKTVLTYDGYVDHYSSCIYENKIYAFMSNIYDEETSLIITDLETLTYTEKQYDGK